MLQLFREKRKNLKWVLWFVILALSGSMLLFFVADPTGGQGLAMGDVARVGDSRISVNEFRRAYSNMIDRLRQQMGRTPERDFLKQLQIDRQVLNQLVSDYAISDEAVRLGLTASPEEIFQEIRSYPAFQDENQRFIGMELYRDFVVRLNYTLPEFEGLLGRMIQARKLRRMLTDTIEASDSDVRQEFLDQNLEVKGRYVAFSSELLQPEIVAKEDLEAYFEENKLRFQGSEKRQAKVLTVEVKPTDVEVSQADIEALADETPDSVRISQVLIPFGDDESAARSQAQEVLALAKGGADFAQLAADHSQDDTSKANGGDIGFIRKGDREATFEQIAFGLEKGQLGEIARTSQGFHIIKVTDVQASQNRAIAEFQARQVKANAEARDLIDLVIGELEGGADLSTAAERHGLTPTLTDFFGPEDTVPGTTAPLTFSQEIFALAEGGRTKPFKHGTSRYFVAELAAVRPPSEVSLDEVRDEVMTEYQKEKGDELARTSAEQFGQSVKAEGADFLKVAQDQGLAITSTEFFKRAAPTMIDDTLKFSPPLKDQAFEMEVGDVTTAIRIAENYVVFQLMEKSPIDEGKFEQDRETIRLNLTERRRSDFFNGYVTKVRERLDREAKIQINQELLDDLTS